VDEEPDPVPILRRAVITLAALVALGLLAACSPTPRPVGQPGVPPPAPTTGVAPGTVVMLIRHGEKPDGSEPGVDANGNEDDSSLTALGWDRARALADLFDPAQGDPRPGLARPTAIYAAGANDDGEGQRTRETVAPLAERLGLPVNTDFGKGDEEKLVEQVTAHPGVTLICWQHGELPDIADAFGSVTPTPPDDWPDDRFDVVWTLTKTADGWRFAQLPELVLPQDTETTIEN
jgi:hypothetical protein